MMELSDNELITRCLQGDQDSFAELVRRYKNLICSTVRYYIKDAYDTPEYRYLKKERNIEIRRLIEELPEKYKTLIVLYHQKGMSYKEMAEKLNKPMSIIKNRMYRARLSLKDSIAGAGYAI